MPASVGQDGLIVVVNDVNVGSHKVGLGATCITGCCIPHRLGGSGRFCGSVESATVAGDSSCGLECNHAREYIGFHGAGVSALALGGRRGTDEERRTSVNQSCLFEVFNVLVRDEGRKEVRLPSLALGEDDANASRHGTF